MTYEVTMCFPKGPTTLPEDRETVSIRRYAGNEKEVVDLQQAALTLGMTDSRVLVLNGGRD